MLLIQKLVAHTLECIQVRRKWEKRENLRLTEGNISPRKSVAQRLNIHRTVLTESRHGRTLFYAFRAYRSTTQTIRDIEPRICSEPDIRKPLDCVPRSRQNENEARQAVYEGRSG